MFFHSVCFLRSVCCSCVCVFPVECQTGDVATLLLMNPAGKNALHFPDLLHETAKVFGLRGRKLVLYLNEELTEGEEHVICHSHLIWLQFILRCPCYMLHVLTSCV